MDQCMNTIETQSQTIDLLTNEVEALKKQIDTTILQTERSRKYRAASAHVPEKTNTYALSADEKHYQKKVLPSMAKRAHQYNWRRNVSENKQFGKK